MAVEPDGTSPTVPAEPEETDDAQDTEPGGPVPEIPNDAQVDIPPEGTRDDTEEIKAAAEFSRFMDWLKLSFAIWVVVGSAVVIVGLSLWQYLAQETLTNADALDNAIDWAKGVAAIALGFAFGRALDEKKNPPRGRGGH